MSENTVSLVLGSGGARGLAHIGVIRCLEDNGYDIRYISGSSIGALIGGIYAAGKLTEYTDWVLELNKTDVVRLLDWSFSFGSIFKGERIIEVLKSLVGDCDIESLSIGYTAVATDLNSEREIWFNNGPLFDAIRASIAVPLVFKPVQTEGMLLVDGGLINPIPIAPVLNEKSKHIIAVDLNAGSEGRPEEHEVPEEETGDMSVYREKIHHFLEKFLPVSDKDNADDMPDALDLMMRSMDLMQTALARFKLAAYTPDVIITIPGDKCGFFEFYRARELIEFGYSRAEAALQKIRG